MHVSTSTITALQKVITGDSLQDGRGLAPYKTWSELVAFFATIHGLDTEGVPQESRWKYVEAVLRRVNGTEHVKSILETAVDPARFLHTDFDVGEAVEYLNDYLVYEGARLVKQGLRFRIVDAADTATAQVVSSAEQVDSLAYASIQEHVSKALGRLVSQDFDGAITTARTLLETVLVELDHRLPGDASDHKGELLRLYRSVQRKLRLDPNDQDVASLQEILRGLTSIASGLGSLRNKMGDAHAPSFRPHRHHAVLAVNAALTVVHFLYETEQYQAALQGPDVV